MNYTELYKPLYHGSNVAVSEIDLSKSVKGKDFGRGFYTTNDFFQAEKFAKLKAARVNAEKGYVSAFSFQSVGELTVKHFSTSDEEWFDFVLSNRGYRRFVKAGTNQNYDIVIGPVANDAVGVVLNLFISGTYGSPDTSEAKETAIRLLLAQKLHNQVFFGTERAVSGLLFTEVRDVYTD